jgi:hypothetical protein
MVRPALLCLVLVCALLGVPGGSVASAADSDAPPGADPTWLPDVDWVMNR